MDVITYPCWDLGLTMLVKAGDRHWSVQHYSNEQLTSKESYGFTLTQELPTSYRRM